MNIDIPSELKSYYIQPSKPTIDLITAIINSIGFEEYIKEQLEYFLNCTKVWKTGQRPVMTTYINYSYEISNTLVAIDLLANGDYKSYCIKLLLDRHKANLEFEANNPYDYKPIKVKQSNPRRKENEQLTIEGLDIKPKKETKAERKLKESAIKLNKLSFNLKPAQ